MCLFFVGRYSVRKKKRKIDAFHQNLNGEKTKVNGVELLWVCVWCFFTNLKSNALLACLEAGRYAKSEVRDRYGLWVRRVRYGYGYGYGYGTGTVRVRYGCGTGTGTGTVFVPMYRTHVPYSYPNSSRNSGRSAAISAAIWVRVRVRSVRYMGTVHGYDNRTRTRTVPVPYPYRTCTVPVRNVFAATAPVPVPTVPYLWKPLARPPPCPTSKTQ